MARDGRRRLGSARRDVDRARPRTAARRRRDAPGARRARRRPGPGTRPSDAPSPTRLVARHGTEAPGLARPRCEPPSSSGRLVAGVADHRGRDRLGRRPRAGPLGSTTSCPPDPAGPGAAVTAARRSRRGSPRSSGARARLGRGPPGGEVATFRQRARDSGCRPRPQRDRGHGAGGGPPASPARARLSGPGSPISSSPSTRARHRRARSSSTDADRPLASPSSEFPQRYPGAGRRRHDPEDIWSTPSSRGRSRGDRGGRRGRADRRHRHDQPARDHGRLGPRDRPARRRRDRLAEPDHRAVLRARSGPQATRRWSASGPASRSTPTSAARRSARSCVGTGLRARAERGRARLRHGRHRS